MPSPSQRQKLGAFGEGHARRFLEARGYVLVEANWSIPGGEIDLVMRDGDELVFVEVKTRHGERAGRAEEAISATKGDRLLALGEHYVSTHPELDGLVWRCDLVAVTLDDTHRVVSVHHYANALVTG